MRSEYCLSFSCVCLRVCVEKSFVVSLFCCQIAITIKLNARINDLYGLTNISISNLSEKYTHSLYLSVLFVEMKCLHMLCRRPIYAHSFVRVFLFNSLTWYTASSFGLFLLFSLRFSFKYCLFFMEYVHIFRFPV